MNIFGPVKRYVLKSIMSAINVNNVMKIRTTIKEAEWIQENLCGVSQFKTRYPLFTHGLDECTVDGLIMEFGVFQGESINYIAKKRPLDRIYGFDSFEGLPETWNQNYQKGAFKTTLPKVNYNVELITGYFEDTLPGFLETHHKPARFIHLDADLYSSTKYVLEKMVESKRLINGTIVQFDEFIRYPESMLNGEAKAFFETIDKHDLKFKYIGYSTSGAGQVTIQFTEDPL